MSAAQQIAALEGLLNRIEQRRAEPGVRLRLPFESAAAAPAPQKEVAAAPVQAAPVQVAPVQAAPVQVAPVEPVAPPVAEPVKRRAPADYTPHEVGGAAAGGRAAPAEQSPEISVDAGAVSAGPVSDGPPLTLEPPTRPSGLESEARRPGETLVSAQPEAATARQPDVEVAPAITPRPAETATPAPASTAPITQASAPVSDQVDTTPRAEQPADEQAGVEFTAPAVEVAALTPPPAPPPAPAIEKAVAGGVIKIEPKTIKPVFIQATNVGEFIGDVQGMSPATFGAAVDASLDLEFER